MEHGSIEREIQIDAPPAVVFEVVSDPAHVKQWWPDDARYEPTPGSSGEIVFTMAGEPAAVGIQVVDAVPHRLFSFRWTQPAGEPGRVDNSFLVTFELTPAGSGTRLRMTEIGFRERGWDDAKVAAEYADHAAGWDHFLPRLATYAARVGAPR